MDTDIARFLVIGFVIIIINSVVGSRDTFYCNGDICNRGQDKQFCSSTYRYCRSCAEIVGSCGKSEQPFNCTAFCVEYLAEMKLKEKKDEKCFYIPNVTNGVINVTNDTKAYDQGNAFEILCNPGFRLEYTAIAHCGSFGEFRYQAPTCKEKLCVALKPIPNGNHNGSLIEPHNQGDVIAFTCIIGYRLKGERIMKCKEYGEWSTETPTCEEITCSKIPPIRHGQWHYKDRYMYQAGDTVTVKCDKTFLLDGPDLWNCSHDGNWKSRLSSYMPVCLPAGESSEKLSLNAWMTILGAPSLLLSIFINVLLLFLYCDERYKRYGRVKPDEVHKDVNASDEEQKQLLVIEDDNCVNDKPVSLLGRKHIRERINPAGTDLPPSVKYEKKEPLQGAEAGTLVHIGIYNNPSNTNTNTLTYGQQQQQQPSTYSDTQEPEVRSKKGQADKTPVEETGTFQPEQPESHDSNTNGNVVEDSQKTFSSVDESSVGELSTSFAEQQTVNNEQDVGQKVTFSGTQINTDDMNVR